MSGGGIVNYFLTQVSHTRSEPLLAKRLPTWVNDLHLATVPYKVTKDYGLFRRYCTFYGSDIL